MPLAQILPSPSKSNGAFSKSICYLGPYSMAPHDLIVHLPSDISQAIVPILFIRCAGFPAGALIILHPVTGNLQLLGFDTDEQPIDSLVQPNPTRARSRGWRYERSPNVTPAQSIQKPWGPVTEGINPPLHPSQRCFFSSLSR